MAFKPFGNPVDPDVHTIAAVVFSPSTSTTLQFQIYKMWPQLYNYCKIKLTIWRLNTYENSFSFGVGSNSWLTEMDSSVVSPKVNTSASFSSSLKHSCTNSYTSKSQNTAFGAVIENMCKNSVFENCVSKLFTGQAMQNDAKTIGIEIMKMFQIAWCKQQQLQQWRMTSLYGIVLWS